MRALFHVVAASVLANLGTEVFAHPGCISKTETPTIGVSLAFCEIEEDGACCTPIQEQDAIAVYEQYGGGYSSKCAELYKQVACAPCSSYAGHLYERLYSELGVGDGVTMKRSFCDELVKACSGDFTFPTYDGQSYCDKHVSPDDEDKVVWSHPIADEAKDFSSTGLVKAFPGLSNSELPKDTIAMHMTPNGDHWWLAGQFGEIKQITSENPKSAKTVLDLTGHVLKGYEEGLLDFAFDPDFHNNDYFYCSYTVKQGKDRKNRLSRFTYNSKSTSKTKNSEYELLTTIAKSNSIHSAGWCGFKPSDYGSTGYHDLYWAVGDGGPQEDPLGRGKDANNMLASIVRIRVSSQGKKPDLSPSGNVKGPVCATGFRNPFRCGFNRLTDDLYCGDVGHTLVEEIDHVKCGNDYGWSRFEGSRCQEAQEGGRFGDCDGINRSGVTFPIFEYCHPEYPDANSQKKYTDGFDICAAGGITGRAVIGGYPYTGQRFSEVLTGAITFADAQSKKIYYLVDEGGGSWVAGTIIGDGSASIISFAEDNDGEQYVITADRVPHMLPCGDLCAKTCLPQEETQPNFKSEGCFADYSGNRALTKGAGSCGDGQDLMSPAICASYCATIPGATKFGVEYAFECFCGDDSDKFDKHGKLNKAECTTLCTGTPDEFCGGKNAIEVYSFSDGTPATPSPLTVVNPTPPTPTNGDYDFDGCYGDSSSDRVFTGKSTVESDMTTEDCAAFCKGSKYFATEYSTECFCSANGNDPDRKGGATCNMDCAGDRKQTCGGRNAFSVYVYTDGGGPTPTPGGGDDYTYLGCKADPGSPRILTADVVKGDNGMTTEVCSDLCSGYAYFGTQYGNECWCGKSSDKPKRAKTSKDCKFKCAGDSSQTCGGFFAMDVYAYDDAGPTPTPPTPTPPTPTPSDDYTFEACKADTSSRVFSGEFIKNVDDMTTEGCADYCDESEYFATQYGKECWCSAPGDKVASAKGSSGCNIECSGDSSQTCGGFFALSVYKFTDAGPSPSPSPPSGGSKLVGCYKDSKSARIMDLEASDRDMTLEECSNICEGAAYYGLSYGIECWCSDNKSYKAIGKATNCNYECGGDRSQICGGYNAMSVYKYT